MKCDVAWCGVIKVDGRYLRFAVSDNENAVGPTGGSPRVAINIHVTSPERMYWRESSRWPMPRLRVITLASPDSAQ